MSHRITKVLSARCVECESRLFFQEKPELGLMITCRECDTKLEVVGLDPIELDWGDDDFDYDDEAYH